MVVTHGRRSYTFTVAINPMALDQPVKHSMSIIELRRRLIAAAIGLVGLGVLAVAGSLNADRDGLGTHTQLGLPACSLKVFADVPCPTCGMTTAFAYAADGRLIQSFITQPAGALLAMATAMASIVGFYVATTGMPIDRWLGWLGRWRSVWIVAGLMLGAWLYKMVVYQGA